MNISRSLVLIVFITSMFSAVRAQGYVNILPPEITAPYFARRDSVLTKLKANELVDWAGGYSIYAGETWSEGFWWAPDVGFATYRDTCSNGPRAWINHGQVTFDNHKLYLSPERNDSEDFLLTLPNNEFTFIRWGEQRWLVPSNNLGLFAYAVNSRSGIEVEIGYLKGSDIEKKRGGLPNLPQEYKSLLKIPPIRAKVIAIDSNEHGWYPAMTIDAGSDQRVIKGMSFWLTGQKNIQVRVVVSEVTGRTAKVELRMVSQTGDFEKNVIPKIAWRFSSRDPNGSR